MEKKVKRSYNRWSQESLIIINRFIVKNDNDIQTLKFVLEWFEGFERSESTICFKVDKQRIILNMEPIYTNIW